MDITVQLNKLNGEIDAVNIKIDDKDAEWKKATTAEDKAFYDRSILRLEDEKKTLIASRDKLFANASHSSQGKDISMAVSPAKLCSSIYANCAIRLVCSNVTALPSPSTCIFCFPEQLLSYLRLLTCVSLELCDAMFASCYSNSIANVALSRRG